MNINIIKMQILMGMNGLNITQLAALSNVSRQTISYIKSGKKCSPIVACKIAKALNVNVIELLNTPN